MKTFIAKRLLLGVVVVFGVVFITFFLTRVIPANPAAQWVGSRATAAQIKAAQIELGLDKPLYIQFARYVADLARGNLGHSLRSHQPIAKELANYLPATLELVLLSTAFAILVGIPLGVASAYKKDRLLDHVSRFFSVGAVSLPTFWVGLFLQLIFYRLLGVLPLGDQLSTSVRLLYPVRHVTGFVILDSLLTGNFIVLKDALAHIVLPGITNALYPIGLVARMTRSALLEILSEDYISAARSYGLPPRTVLWSYALKNSLGPTATVVTLSMGYTLVNTFLIEAIFSWPGIGNYISSAVMALDYPAIMGVTIFSAIAYIVLNLAADVVIALDPRVRV